MCVKNIYFQCLGYTSLCCLPSRQYHGSLSTNKPNKTNVWSPRRCVHCTSTAATSGAPSFQQHDEPRGLPVTRQNADGCTTGSTTALRTPPATTATGKLSGYFVRPVAFSHNTVQLGQKQPKCPKGAIIQLTFLGQGYRTWIIHDLIVEAYRNLLH